MKPISICKKNNPNKIIEDNETYYFYWPIELGLTYITICKKRIPIFPIKLTDYEPLKETKFKGKIGMMTIFHYDILVYFNDLILDANDRPIADFIFGSHSPIMYSNIKNSKIKIFRRIVSMVREHKENPMDIADQIVIRNIMVVTGYSTGRAEERRRNWS